MMKAFKKLAIISDCVHFISPNGIAATENHIFLRQMEVLAKHFSHTIICCPFVEFSDNKIYTEYTGAIEFYATPNVGGNKVSDKLTILKTIPAWLKVFKKIKRQADCFYLRFPDNLNIPGFFYFNFTKKILFASYAGTWKNYPGEPSTYRFQKYLLKHFFKGPVFAYLEKDEPKYHLYKTFSPSYFQETWEEESENVALKINGLHEGKKDIPVFISVGAFNAQKNQQFILEALKILHEKDIDFKCYLVGDGPLKQQYAAFIAGNSLTGKIFLMGKLKANDLRMLYRKSDFLIQASLIEGYGKVPVEGYFHGVIPFLHKTQMTNVILDNGKCGFAFEANDPVIFAQFLMETIQQKSLLAEKIIAGRNFSKGLTLEKWSARIVETVQNFYER
ncbi:MAG: glycosyltransferase [Chitinophagaceae bacterium]